MKYRLIIKPDAEWDMTETALWYETQKHGLGEDFLQAIEDKFEIICGSPLVYAIRYKTIRVAFVRKFPYGIHFLLDDNTVIVLAILHTKRNPAIWERRSL